MNGGKTIISRLTDFLPLQFQECVVRYHGDYKLKSFSWW